MYLDHFVLFSLVGWFYHDEYIGKEPNAKLKKQLAKKKKLEDEAEPLPLSNLEVESPGRSVNNYFKQ